MAARQQDLFTGQGIVGIVYDVVRGEFVPYDGTDGFHSLYGGRTYYHSRSGISHAGFVPGVPAVRVVSGYRADEHRIMFAGLTPCELFGWRLLAPYSYGAGTVDDDYPVVVWNSDGTRPALIMSVWEIPKLLTDGLEGVNAPTQEFKWRVFCSTDATSPEEVSVYMQVTTGCPRRHLCRVVEALNYERLRFRETLPEPNAYWSRMGLHPSGDGADAPVIKLVSGVGRSRYTRDQLADRTVLAEAAPNVTVLSSGAILAEEDCPQSRTGWRWQYYRPDGRRAFLPNREAISLMVHGDSALADLLAETAVCGLAPWVAALWSDGEEDFATALAHAEGGRVEPSDTDDSTLVGSVERLIHRLGDPTVEAAIMAVAARRQRPTPPSVIATEEEPQAEWEVDLMIGNELSDLDLIKVEAMIATMRNEGVKVTTRDGAEVRRRIEEAASSV